MAALPLVKAGRLRCEYYPVKAFRAYRDTIGEYVLHIWGFVRLVLGTKVFEYRPNVADQIGNSTHVTAARDKHIRIDERTCWQSSTHS
jgi:hypothetical protein